MLGGNTPVATVSATDNHSEETSVFNGPLQVETRRAEARWPAEPRQPLERALLKHTVTEPLLDRSESLQGTVLC